MTIDEYLQMQQPFGYKVEYINGEAIFEPRELHVDARLPVTQRQLSAVWNFVSVDTGWLQPMQEAFFTAFHDSIEFCDWPEHAIRKHAGTHIDAYFALNQASQDWHHAFGFEDVYDQYFIRMKYGWYRREIHRLKALGVTGNLAALQQECDCWYKLLEDDWKSGL